MQRWVRLSMETKRPCICVRACRHVSAPDHPEAGRRFLPLVRGPVTIQGVRDPRGVRDSCGGPDSSGGLEPRLLALECLPLPGHVASPDLSQPWNGSGPLSGEQGFGPQGSDCLDIVKGNYKGPCLDTARDGTPFLGYRQTPSKKKEAGINCSRVGMIDLGVLEHSRYGR